jgi:hypothetical protein
MLKMKGLDPAMLIPGQIAIHETQPNAASWIRGNSTGGRH